MKRVMFVLSGAVLMISVASAQPPAAPAQTPPTGQKIGLAASIQRSYAGIKMNLTQNAEKMPDADYNFKPGSMPEVRPYGALFLHVANAHFGGCAAVKGVPNPNQGVDLEKTKTTKADIVKALADSFAFCDDAFSGTTDENAVQMVKAGPNEVTRAAALYGQIAHDNEMFGTSNVYLRSKGLVPSSTERQGRGRGRGNQ
jgi:DinB family protein